MVFRRVPGPSNETRQRVLEAAEKLGYRPNRSAALLSSRRSHLIGVMANIRNTFHAELVEDIVAEADAYGYEVVLGAVTPTHGESAVVDTLLDFRCEALILLGPNSRMRLWPNSATRRRSSSSVDASRARRSMWCARPTGAVSDASSTTWSSSDIGGSVISAAEAGTIPNDRKAGYVRAMKRHGLAEAIDIIDGDFTEQAGILAARQLLAAARPPDRSMCGQRPQRDRAPRRAPPFRNRRARRYRCRRLRRQCARQARSHRSDHCQPRSPPTGRDER